LSIFCIFWGPKTDLIANKLKNGHFLKLCRKWSNGVPKKVPKSWGVYVQRTPRYCRCLFCHSRTYILCPPGGGLGPPSWGVLAFASPPPEEVSTFGQGIPDQGGTPRGFSTLFWPFLGVPDRPPIRVGVQGVMGTSTPGGVPRPPGASLDMR
jgi:hypothetical protein